MIPRLAFIKYGGLAAGGTERLLQEIAVELVNQGLQVDYFFCEPRVSPGSFWIHPPNDKGRRRYLESAGVKLIEFHIDYKDLSTPDHFWVANNFFEIFDEKRYEMVWTAKAGPKEYPFYCFGIPFVEVVTLDAGFDDSSNRLHSILISNWQRNKWISKGGDEKTSSILPLSVANNASTRSLRTQLRIPTEKLVLGFHQRVDNEIVSTIPFESIAELEDENLFVLIMGGGEKYRDIANDYNIQANFLPHNSEWLQISRFLKTIDIYTHGRADGETFGTVLAEAMSLGLPVISHSSPLGANAHVETIANGGFFAYSRQEYTSLLGSLIKDSALRARLGANGKAFAEATYSAKAFKNNIAQILPNLGLMKPLSNKVRKPKLSQAAPRVLPGTRVLVHGLPDTWIKRGIELGEQIQTTKEILTRFNLHNPRIMAVTGFASLLVAIEIGRGLPNPKLVIYEEDEESYDFIIQLMKINGLFEFALAKQDLLDTIAEDEIILSFSEELQNGRFGFTAQRLISEVREVSQKRYSFNLLLPLFDSGKLRVVRKRINIDSDTYSKSYYSTQFFLANIYFVIGLIMNFQLIRARKTKLYKRFVHLRFLTAKIIKSRRKQVAMVHARLEA